MGQDSRTGFVLRWLSLDNQDTTKPERAASPRRERGKLNGAKQKQTPGLLEEQQRRFYLCIYFWVSHPQVQCIFVISTAPPLQLLPGPSHIFLSKFMPSSSKIIIVTYSTGSN